jgi:hypothetical protein
MFKTKFSWGAFINRFRFSDLGFKSIQNKVFKIYLGQLVRYGTEIIKGVGIPQSGQVIINK